MGLKTFFAYGPYLMFIVTFCAFVLRCRFRVRVQAVWGMVLLVCFSKFFLFCQFGDTFTPELPEQLIWAWNWAYSGAVALGVLSVLTVAFRFRSRAFVLPVLAWGISALGLWNGVSVPAVREVVLEYGDLPASLDGYRIVQLSDLHVSAAARQWRTERLVQKVNACNGDLVVLTGDIVDGNPRERRRDVMPLKDLRAKDGVYAVTGNHETYFDIVSWMPWFERWGIRFLNNVCVFPRKELALGGVDDKALPELHTGEDYKAVCPSVVRTFAAATNGEFRVFLEHRPKHAPENILLHGVRLQLSGHTHGGIMPPMRAIVAKYNGGFVRGLYQFQTSRTSQAISYAYVSPGVGQWVGFPIRFFNPSEITVFTLRRIEVEGWEK